jgi:hypothetical protein
MQPIDEDVELQQEDFFKTQDILLAATLNPQYPVERMERDTTSPYANDRSIFVFKNSPELQNIINKWNDYILQVEPRKWYSNVKQLKSMAMLNHP